MIHKVALEREIRAKHMAPYGPRPPACRAFQRALRGSGLTDCAVEAGTTRGEIVVAASFRT